MLIVYLLTYVLKNRLIGLIELLFSKMIRYLCLLHLSLSVFFLCVCLCVCLSVSFEHFLVVLLRLFAIKLVFCV